MDGVFLEIVSESFTEDDFQQYQLPMSFYKGNEGFKMIFFKEEQYFNYVNELENLSNVFLYQYWMTKSMVLVDKNKFIIKVLTTMSAARLKKYKCLE